MVLRRTAVGVVALVVACASCGVANAVVITFSDVSADSPFLPGDGFTASGVPVKVDAAVQPLGQYLPTGAERSVRVGTGMAGGFGNELQLSNAAVTFDFPDAAWGVVLQFGQYEQGINLAINNQLIVADSLASLNGWITGDAALLVPAVSPAGLGVLMMLGNISSFSIGGASLAIDNVIASAVIPEPATLGLLLVSSLVLLGHRRRFR